MRGERGRRKRSLIGLAIVADVLVLSVVVSPPATAADSTSPSTPKNLRVTASSTSTIDIAWDASSDNVGVAAYIVVRDGVRLAKVKAPRTAYDDGSVGANEMYTYRVRARDAAGNRSKISRKLVATASSAVVVAAAGDIACDPSDSNYHNGTGTSTACRQLYTSNILVNGDFDAVLALGDLQYNSGSLDDFNEVYDPTWGRVKSITYPVVGNHEYGQSNASDYFQYFGSRAGPAGKGYYSFDLASWHIVAINSECDEIGGCGTGSTEETWLRNDLASHPAECTIAMWHHGRYSSGHDGDNTFMQPMWSDLYRAGVEILLSGHSHDYERFAPQDDAGHLDNSGGVRQFIVGTGGAFFTGLGTSFDDNSQAHQNTTYGVLQLTLRSGAYDWKFLPEAGKTYTDSGTTSCH
jgi:calcineurin-like phosphoesterase family protein